MHRRGSALLVGFLVMVALVGGGGVRIPRVLDGDTPWATTAPQVAKAGGSPRTMTGYGRTIVRVE